MTYQERQRYRKLRDELDELRETLAEGDPEEALTRGEALEILGLVDAAIERMSPERWDRALDAVAEEAARRARSRGPTGGGFPGA
jgi:hypothetical protein